MAEEPQVGGPAADEVAMRLAGSAQILALEAQLAIERERNRRLEAQLRNLADHDPLTDLLNRRTFEHELQEHVAGCTRYGPEGAVLLVGLDGLEEIAGALGPWAADEAVAVVAEGIAERLRVTDVVGRWAPTELAVLLPRASAAEGGVVADALVEVVRGAGTPRVPPGSLIASIGVAPVVAAPVEAGDLLAQVDRALATARRMGGACWVAAGG